ncbi:MAG: hypothetical protein P4L76_16800 [Beijerinckiaceae bacterium]|nr:hypothetical protein [Beijerinckiaceae bacterium]
MSVIKLESGKKNRQTVRRFRQLLGLEALHEANIRSNPVPYIERASERIFHLQRALFEAAEASKSSFGSKTPPKMIEVDELEYRRLLRCRAIVEKALDECRADSDDP